MTNFAEVMKQKIRMCDSNSCSACPLYYSNNGVDKACGFLFYKMPQKAEEIIMKWAEEHPVQTNADKFKEVFGFNPHKSCAFGFNCSNCQYDEGHHCGKKWWEEEYKAPKGEE